MNNNDRVLYEYFIALSYYVKMNKFLQACNINHSNFSNYLKYGNIGAVSREKLNELYLVTQLELEKLIKFA